MVELIKEKETIKKRLENELEKIKNEIHALQVKEKIRSIPDDVEYEIAAIEFYGDVEVIVGRYSKDEIEAMPFEDFEYRYFDVKIMPAVKAG